MRPRQFRVIVFGAGLFFLALQIVYVTRLPLVMDEFQGAHDVLRLADSLPYRDFRPYKTVLGYYLQLPMLVVVDDWWSALIASKIQLAVLSTIAIVMAAFSLANGFRREAVVLGLILLVVMSTFVERAAELRVDMLTAVAGLASLLLITRGRFLAAGLLAGTAFLVSQKGIYYVVAAEVALAAWWLWGGARSNAVRGLVRLNAGVAVCVGAYLAFWIALVGPRPVLHATFVTAGGVAMGEHYSLMTTYWIQTLTRNPLFYLLGFVAVIVLFLQRTRQHRVPPSLLFGYGVTLGLLCLWHKQPWPYFFVLLVPTLFVLQVALFDLALENGTLKPRRTALILVGLLLGILWPLSRVTTVLERENGLQRSTVWLLDDILPPDAPYLAGVFLLPDRPQTPEPMQWLDSPRRERLRELPTDEVAELASRLERDPPMVFVDNYRLRQLPEPLREVLARSYIHFWSNVFVYSPVFADDETECRIAVEGWYRLEPDGGGLRLDGRPVDTTSRLRLEPGIYPCRVEGSARLMLDPVVGPELLVPEYREAGVLFPDVYEF